MGSLSAVQNDPNFPLELEREIFEVCALNDTKTIPKLMLVAQRTKEWLEPLLFRTIYFCNVSYYLDGVCDRRPMPIEAFMRAVETKPMSFFDNIRHLLVLGSISAPDLRAICDACRSPVDVFINFEVSYTLPIISSLNITRLAASIDALFYPPIDFAHPLFSHVTHLSLTDAFIGRLDVYKGVEVIPHLTHLSFAYPGFLPICAPILRSCPKLRVLLLHCSTISHEAAALGQEDLRFVATTDFTFFPFEVWQRGLRGGKDKWTLVEDFIAKRVRGEIDRSSYIIPLP
ncbi:hypothetical protein C8R43DRAFT_1229314 [Mycena crocata]|nr:hypothetical protein C8R43DRAFT_1229314 [Mycena crocata]